MSEKKYTKTHEWVRPEGEEVVVGITAHATEQLGDVVFVDLPATGISFKKGDEVATVESVKAASEVYAPVDGEITDVNTALADSPATLNSDPDEAGWFFRMKLTTPVQLEDLMDQTAYHEFAGD